MITSIFLLAAAIPANTLSVTDGEAIAGAEYVYPIAGVDATDQAGTPALQVSTGLEISNIESDYSIGEFLTDIPSGDIDWERTYAAITNDAALYKNKVYCVPNAESDAERLLFTQGGAVSLVWYYQGSDNVSTSSYQIAENSSERPNRLYWTSAPFLGPTIDLSGKFVRLFGNPDLLKQEVTVDEATHTTNVVSGICLTTSASSQVLEAKAQVLDVDAQTFQGPSGQFVLAYYADGNKSKFIGSVVVEVGRPQTKILDAHVGDELLPTGDGWSVKGLLPYPKDGKGGTETVEGDAASPHMTRAEYTRTDTGDQVFAAYAISPNDKTTRDYAADAPTKNDIFWEKPDLTGTLWPFEEDLYNVTWNDADPMVVYSDDTTQPGLEIYVPTNYTVAVCDYQDPSETAALDSGNANVVRVRKEGRFTLKLTTTAKAGADVWYLPMMSKSRTNAAVANALPRGGGVLASAPAYDVAYPVGHILEPLALGFAGTASNAYAAVDTAVGGYVYAAASTGRNWNPRLYHAPVAPSVTADVTVSDGTATTDAFAALASSIYSVAPSATPIEVWWCGRCAAPSRLFGASSKLTYPAAVERYLVREPLAEEIPEIALASKLGSAGKGRAPSERSLRLTATNAVASVADPDLFNLPTDGFTFTVDVNPTPDEVPSLAAADGTLLTFLTANSALVLETVESPEEATNTCAVAATVCYSPDGTNIEGFVYGDLIPADRWSTFALTVTTGTNGVRQLALGWNGEIAAATNLTGNVAYFSGALEYLGVGELLEASAVGPALDNVSFKEGESVLADWTFESVCEDTSAHNVADATAFGRTLELGAGAETVPGGAPVVTTTGVPYNDEVTPEVYREADATAVGYHPNYAHAFTRLGDSDGDYVTWAVRSDLGTTLSDRLVFTMYSSGGKGAQRTYRVVETNEFYTEMASATTVGHQFLPPAPLCYLDDYWCDATSWASCTDNADVDKCIVYRDRKQNDWARRDGNGFAFYFYKPLSTFDWPSGTSVSTYMPWQDGGTGKPRPWAWTSAWPDDDDIPTMKVAQTLTKATGGLPEVWNMASCAVIYPQRGLVDGDGKPIDVVDLVDPTVAQTAALPISTSLTVDYGFTVGSAGTCQLRKGKYYFTGLPPSISERFYVDTNADASKNMVLIGQLVEPATGNPYLQINVLSDTERQALIDIGKNASAENQAKWTAAVETLATAPVLPSQEFETTEDWISAYAAPTSVTYAAAYRPVYTPVDHYALMASGNGAGYVVLIENDATNTAMVAQGDAVNVQVIKVKPELYAGSIRPLTDPLNKLSEQLTIQYNEPFGAATTNYVFEWRRRGAEADGTVNTDYPSWDVYRSEPGLTSFTIGTNGTSLAELVNKYYILRYRAKEGTMAAETCGTNWSAFTSYTLAEGWVQRVLNAVTPFNQRLSDFYANAADIRYTMLEQIGAPYVGDVALNDSNLESIGLLQLYRTVLSKAEKMSLDMNVQDVDVNKQLLLATSRIADLYMLLGAEAYSDAKNPLISQGLSDTYLADLASLPSSTFCFQNQVSTLLDEELALLRGRDNAVQNPSLQTSPIYNRLLWNFTKGVTEGEVAYVNNYGIRADSTGDVTVDAAEKQYPQGHGDAWGHYLDAVKGYYHLLRNPNFGWSASMMEMMVSASVVNQDYQDEQKFADAAVKLAQTGLDTVDLTARKAWRDNGGEMRAAYFDGSTDGQNFGYGETGVRAALGAAYSWLAVNSILPTNAAPVSVYTDKGITQLTRGTASQLDELAALYGEIEDKVNALDSGLNPLGLSQNAIPMDLDPTDLENRNSHFEQILARAEKALSNCDTVLAWANKYGARLQQIGNKETTAEADEAAQELAYKNQLIAIYGTPFSGDIGAGGSYEQGYDGPDLYHYMWMDLSEFGLSVDDLKARSVSVTLPYKKWSKDVVLVSGEVKADADAVSTVYDSWNITFSIAANGIILPTVENPGLRAQEGSIQTAYRTYLKCMTDVGGAATAFAQATAGSKDTIERAIEEFNYKYRVKVAKETIEDALTVIETTLKTAKTIKSMATSAEEIADQVNETTMDAVPSILGAGFTINTDPRAIAKAALAGPLLASELASKATADAAGITELVAETAKSVETIIFDGLTLDVELAEARSSLVSTIKEALSKIGDASSEYGGAILALQAAQAAYRAEIAKGDQLQEERATWRAKVAGEAAQLRYLDMYARVERNNILTKYATAYDTAQRYVWELAKVYDYETGLLSADPQSAAKFYAEIIGSRQLGYEGVSTSAATDKGLYDVVNRMKENFAVLKPRLGINNPDTTTKQFSLRYECFRIDPGVRGDAAWKTELRKYWTDDINSQADFRRHCQPLADAGTLKEPGLVIPFATTVETAKNFFGQSLQGGDHAYSSADYATKIAKVGVTLVGYDALAAQTTDGLASDPNVYLVPVGRDFLRAPTTKRQVIGYNVVDQVLPLPYTIGSTELDDEDYITTFSGLDGTSDSAAKIRRHSTLVADGSTYSTRLCGRSVWNDKWLLVIPAASLNANRTEGLETFIKGVSDIKIGLQAYSRAGN